VSLTAWAWRVLQEARCRVFTPVQLASPLARKPYDCRHVGVSWRLNAGVPAPLVAECAGHTVEVLRRIYAHCLDGDDDKWFGAMDASLGKDLPGLMTSPPFRICSGNRDDGPHLAAYGCM
jgi:integrase